MNRLCVFLKKRLQLLILFGISCLNFFAIYSQSILFEPIENQSKLSNTTITHITQDSLGFLWVSTYDGLHRYDGNELHSFQYDTSSSKSLPSNIVLQTEIDSKQNLWGITPTKGIFKINLVTEQVSTFPELNSTIIKKGKNVNNILIDKNNIWLGCDKGLIELHISKNKVVLKKIHTPTNITYPRISFLKKVPQGILLRTNPTLFLFKKDRTWRKISEKDYLAYGWDIKHHENNSKPILKSKWVFLDSKNNIWLNKQKDLFVVKDKKLFKCNIKNNSETTIRSIFEDSSNTIWLGTTDGIYKYIPLKNEFRIHRFNTDKNSKNISITSLETDKKNKLWVGTGGAGIYVVDSLALLKGKTTIKNPKQRSIGVLKRDIQGVIWGGYEESQDLIQYKHHQKDSFTNIHHHITKNYKKIVDIDFDEDEIWLSTISNGVFKISNITSSKSIRQFIGNDFSKTNFLSNIARSILIDTKQNIWIGTDKGLALLTPKERKKEFPKFKIFNHLSEDKTSISEDFILPIIEGKDGSIWIGTFGGGLNQCTYNPSNNRYEFKSFTTKDGLTNNTVKSIVEDNNGIIWIGTNNSISSLNPKTLYIQNFHKKDGLSDNIFMDLSVTKLPNGNLIFGGQTGITHFNPLKIKKPLISHKPIFTKLEINNHEIIPDFNNNKPSILQKKIEFTKNISLNGNENNLSLDISSLNLLNSSNIRLDYKLEPFHKNWITLNSNDNSITLNSIPPGEYILKARNNINPDKLSTLKIKIKKPFWKKNLLWILFLFSLIIFSFFYFKKNTLKSKENSSESIEKTDSFPKINSEDYAFLNKIKTIILKELSNPDFGVLQLTQEIGLSEYLCNKKLKSITSLTTNAYIRQLKLEQASLLLKSSNLTIAEVTYKVGFRDLQYFRKCFKAEYKITPNEFQKKHKS